jgi:hypothetical protein
MNAKHPAGLCITLVLVGVIYNFIFLFVGFFNAILNSLTESQEQFLYIMVGVETDHGLKKNDFLYILSPPS